MYQSDSSLTGAPICADRTSWPGMGSSDRIWSLCHACAIAEGYDLGAGHVPFDLNNPGDLSDGAKTFGCERHSGSDVTKFPTAEIGWQYLYDKWRNIVNGKSLVYPADMTFDEVAQKWAGNSAAWLGNVTNFLRVSPNEIPADFVRGGN